MSDTFNEDKKYSFEKVFIILKIEEDRDIPINFI
jgi:hypothetical protein